MLNVTQKGDFLLFTVIVRPGARKDAILGIQDSALKIEIKAPPVEGKANKAVVRLIAEGLGIPPSRVEITRGAKSKKKRVRVSGVTVEGIKGLGIE